MKTFIRKHAFKINMALHVALAFALVCLGCFVALLVETNDIIFAVGIIASIVFFVGAAGNIALIREV
jgi:hypothetical protein